MDFGISGKTAKNDILQFEIRTLKNSCQTLEHIIRTKDIQILRLIERIEMFENMVFWDDVKDEK